jgi:hypothetical protein
MSCDSDNEYVIMLRANISLQLKSVSIVSISKTILCYAGKVKKHWIDFEKMAYKCNKLPPL